MKFGVFDHLDDARRAARRALCRPRCSSRKRSIAAAFTPITLPNITARRSAWRPRPRLPGRVAQRTKKLRFGPMVYLLPFYHPLRLIEEVCMLDQMSGGRLELGVGRGVSPFEVGELCARLRRPRRCTTRRSRSCSRVSIREARPSPASFSPSTTCRCCCIRCSARIRHCGTASTFPENADWPAQNDINVIALAPPQAVRPFFDRYRAPRSARQAGLRRPYRRRPPRRGRRHRCQGARHRPPRLSEMVGRTFSGCSSATARRRGSAPDYPRRLSSEVQALGTAIAGSPETVRDFRQGAIARRRDQLLRRPGSPSATWRCQKSCNPLIYSPAR